MPCYDDRERVELDRMCKIYAIRPEKDFVDAMRKFVSSSECAPGYLITPEYAEAVLREDFGISSIYPDIKTIFEIEGGWGSVTKPAGWAPHI